MLTKEWIEPRNVNEARQFADAVAASIREIQDHLSSRNVTDREGNRLTEQEYWRWRDRAKTALRHYEKQHRRLKRWIKEHQNVERAMELTGTIDPANPRALLFNLYGLMRHICRVTGYEPSDAEYAVMDLVRDYFQGEI